MKGMKKRGKKGVSPVIATVLLVLMSVTLVIVIARVVVPFVRDSLLGSKECFEAVGQLTINTESGYTCYKDEGTYKRVNLTVKRGAKDADIGGLIIAVSGAGVSKTFEVKEGSTDVQMMNGSTNIEIPKKGEERTYSMTVNLAEVGYVEIAPIMESGGICDATEKAEIEECR